jgi:glycosyltransferase involved in cell wall biosynthesis
MITAHLLTKNNEATINSCLDSIKNYNIVVADLGSTDLTREICKSYGADVHYFDCPRHEARNKLIQKIDSHTNMFIEPWEILVSESKSATGFGTVMYQKTITKEIRFWKEGRFINPVYERLDIDTDEETGAIFLSQGRRDYADLLEAVELWRNEKPTLPSPHYYKACILLAQGHWDDFLRVSEHYMFLQKEKSMSFIMNRYYYAMGSLIRGSKIKPVLQNLNLCLCERPLMAEFWCLLGDVYYHKLGKFEEAKEFYENAIILGSRRLKTDKWPMDLAKYREYPQKMIESCQKISKQVVFFGR